MTNERQLPKKSKKLVKALFVLQLGLFVVAFGLVLAPTLFRGAAEVAEALFLTAFVLLAVLVIQAALHRPRCPECSAKLTFRAEPIPFTPTYRRLYDCPGCRTTWDSGQIGNKDDDRNV